MKNKKESDYFSDYAEFNNLPHPMAPPFSLSFKIRDQIKSDLEPELKTIFLQLLFLHIISGGITLLICPQFGIGPLGGGDGMMGFVEHFGHLVCGIFCGSFFVSLTTILSWVFLREEIQRAIKKNQFMVYPFLGMLSFFALATFSTMINGTLPHLHAEFLLPWFGAVCLFPILINALKTVIKQNG